MQRAANDITITTLLQQLRKRDLSAEEWSQLDQLAMDDPFLKDAITGLRSIPPGQRTLHLRQLISRTSRQKPERRTPVLWLGIAATLAIAVTATWWIFRPGKTPAVSVMAPAMDTSKSIEMTEDLVYTDVQADKEPVSDGAETTGTSSQPSVRERRTEPGTSTVAGAQNEPVETFSQSPGAETDQDDERIHFAAGAERSAYASPALTYPPEVRGIIMNDAGEPLQGAQITLKGTQQQTYSDVLGNFSLDLPKDPSMNALVIAHDDYSPIEAKAIDGDSLVVRLQEEEVAEVKTMSQKRASFPGSAASSFASPADGERSYQRYIKQNLRYPSEAKAARIHGKVIVEFDVTDDGSPTNLRIIRSLGYGCDEEAMRLVRTGPKWKSSQGSIGRREIDF